jgi:hypothetical protein
MAVMASQEHLLRFRTDGAAGHLVVLSTYRSGHLPERDTVCPQGDLGDFDVNLVFLAAGHVDSGYLG